VRVGRDREEGSRLLCRLIRTVAVVAWSVLKNRYYGTSLEVRCVHVFTVCSHWERTRKRSSDNVWAEFETSCVCRLPYVWFCAYGGGPWTMLWRMLTSHVGVQVWGLSTKEGGGSPSHTCLHTHTPQDAGAIKLYLKTYHCQCSEVHSAHLRAVQWLLWMFSWFKMFQISGEKYLIPGGSK
jgi:hypothetical protein